MNITSYIHDRQYGLVSHKSRRFKYKQLDQFLDEKTTDSFVNKACAASGTCRSTFIMEFSPDGTKVASTHGDHTVRVTDIVTGQCVRTLQGHPRTPWCLAYHPSSSHILASGCLGGQVRIWDLYGYGCEVWQAENSNVVASLTFHPTDHVLVIGAGNSIYFWDWSQPEPFTKCSTSHVFERIRWLRFDALGHNLYTGISNNTSIHREEVTGVSLTNQSQTSSTAGRQPSRLNSVYSRIINCYQEYRRDRLSQETSLRPDEPGPSHQTSSDNTDDLYPGVSDIDIVEPRSPSTTTREPNRQTRDPSNQSANNVLDQVIHLSSSSTEHSNTTGFPSVSDCLINPRSDPFLTPGPSQSIFVDSAESNLFPTVSESEIPASTSNVESTSIEHIQGPEGVHRRNSNNLSDFCPEGSDVNLGISSTVSSASSITSGINVVNDMAHGASVTTSTSDSQGSANRNLTDRVQTLSESIRTSITSSSDINPYLAKYLQSQVSWRNSLPPATTQPSRAFPSIRDRLQTNIPLVSEASESAGISQTMITTSGIPPVTILSGSDISRPVSVQSDSFPRVSVVYSHSTEHDSSSRGAGPISTSVTDNWSSHADSMTVSNGNSGAASTKTCYRDDDSAATNSSQKSCSLNDKKTVDTAKPDGTINDTCNTSPFSEISNSGSNLSVDSENFVTRVTSTDTIPNTVHLASSIQSFRRDRVDRERRSSRGRSQPYHWSRSRHSEMSIMAPYLHSRGVSVPDPPTTTNYRPVLPLTERALFRRNQSHSNQHGDSIQENMERNYGVQDGRQNDSDIHNRSDQSGYYFVPISEHSRPAMSDANLSENSSEEQSSSRVLNQNSVRNTSRVLNDQPVELFVDQNENYTGVRNANTLQTVHSANEVQVSTNDNNNNSLLIVLPQDSDLQTTTTTVSLSAVATSTVMSTVGSSDAPSTVTSTGDGQDCEYIALRNTFVSMTDQIEREMSDLNRRINALRDSFNQSLFSLRQDRQRYENVGQAVNTAAPTSRSRSARSRSERPRLERSSFVTTSSQSRNVPVIVTSVAEPPVSENDPGENEEETQGFMIQPPTLLETSLRSHRRGRQQSQFLQRPYLESAAEPQDWRQLQRHYLHPHYSSSIFDETINRPSNAIQSAINRAIAGAFMGTGESAVANNIINQTHRVQYWDFTKCAIPDISCSTKNIIVAHCKLHNSASCDLSQDGSLLATFVPSHHGFPDDNILAVYSLLPENKGQCLYTKSFGPNAISISISPSNNYILVGLAAKKLSWVFTARQMVAQIYKLEKKEAGEKSTKLIKDIFHICSNDIRTHVSGNSARWLPGLGQGLVYGTNRGHLQICKPGVKTAVRKVGLTGGQNLDLAEDDQSESVRRFILRRVPWLTHSDPHRVSASTQTQGTRNTAATQTDTEARGSQ